MDSTFGRRRGGRGLLKIPPVFGWYTPGQKNIKRADEITYMADLSEKQ